tara:strand:+ start:5264 stop:6397 length:1134 start_codon:yes stop_codon:yes gene_type:complete
VKNFIISSYLGNYEYSVKNNLDVLLRDIKLENYNLLVIDSKISSNYPSIEKSLEINKISIEVDSESKSIEKLPYFLSLFIECDLKKGSKILVVGGATMQDIFGTVCCLYFRGLEWGFVPTTILAQGDSCVGSKTSLDGFGRKNQFGVFYPPIKIYICRDFLNTLPIKEIYSGIGDVMHYLLPYDEDNKFLSELLSLSISKNISKLIDFSILISSKAMKIKSELLKIDEFDKGPRKIFNFGHTFGHAIEKSTNIYLPHGIAVLCGLLVSLNFHKFDSSLESFIFIQRETLKQLINIIFINENLNISVNKKDLKKNLLSDKKNTLFYKVRVIIPTSNAESLWTSQHLKSVYGLNYIDSNLNYCLEVFECLDHINGINFI